MLRVERTGRERRREDVFQTVVPIFFFKEDFFVFKNLVFCETSWHNLTGPSTFLIYSFY